MKAAELSDYFWARKPRRLNERDEVAVDGDTVYYYVWGNPIAILKRQKLIVDDCGWRTWLTKTRLNNILYRLSMSIYSDRGQWFLNYDDKDLVWMGRHQIDFSTRPFKIDPYKLRTRNEKVSQKLKLFYENVKRTLRRKVFPFKTLTGEGVVCLRSYGDRRFSRTFLLLLIQEPMVEAHMGVINLCQAYRAITTGKFAAFFKNKSYDINPEEIPEVLERWEIDFSRLPSKIVDMLAIHKLVG
ncbi:MAG TPA: hypothetical protein ENG66_09280 [Thermococcus sp.]|nr:hypothetical protein [Thermococcus sp.]